MLAAEFDFDVPDSLIAQYPVEPREHSRLMVIHRSTGRIEHHRFSELPEILNERDILARNNSRVIPARLIGRRALTGGKWEGLFLREAGDGTWEVLASTRGRPSIGEQVIVDSGLSLRLEDRKEGGTWLVRPLPKEGTDSTTAALTLLERHGQTPIPPYIRRGREVIEDRTRYQTVFALRPGSVAAPTAGLHFSDAVFQNLAARGIGWVDLTLHVGLGTFRPMDVENVADHVMHSEWAEISAQSADALNTRRASGGRVVAVGTTSARTLETAAAGGVIRPFAGQTGLFIRPGHVFRGLDALITNFHLPRSSLLVLVSAFGGIELIRAAYKEAIDHRYRFFSYGDAMLIL